MATDTANKQVTFYGGPCNGENHFYSSADLASGQVTCKAVLYQVTPVGGNFYNARPEASASIPQGTTAQFAPDLFRAYHALARAIGSELRPAITQALRYDQRALQSLSRHRKVRKH